MISIGAQRRRLWNGAGDDGPAAEETAKTPRKKAERDIGKLPEHLPRCERMIEPASLDVSETLDREHPIAHGHHRFDWLYVTAFVSPASGETFWYMRDGVSKPFFAAQLSRARPR